MLTCFRYSYYRIDKAVGAEKRLLHRAIEKWLLAVARGWAVLLTGRVFARRNEDEHPDWRHYRPALGGRS